MTRPISNVFGTCALCGTTAELRLSHILPKFLFDRLKEDSISGRMVVPEKRGRLQDGPKRRLLCGACEERLAVSEAWFSKLHASYIEKKQLSFEIDEADVHFAASLVWRSLVHHGDCFDTEEVTFKPLSARQKRVLEPLRRYLLNERPHPPDIRHHLLSLHSYRSDVEASNALAFSAIGTQTSMNSSGFVSTSFLGSGLLIATVLLDGLLEWPLESRMAPGATIHLSSVAPKGWQEDFHIQSALMEVTWKRVHGTLDIRPIEECAHYAVTVPPSKQLAFRARMTRFTEVATLEFCYVCDAPLIIRKGAAKKYFAPCEQVHVERPDLRNQEFTIVCSSCRKYLDTGDFVGLLESALAKAKSPYRPGTLSKATHRRIESRIESLSNKVLARVGKQK